MIVNSLSDENTPEATITLGDGADTIVSGLVDDAPFTVTDFDPSEDAIQIELNSDDGLVPFATSEVLGATIRGFDGGSQIVLGDRILAVLQGVDPADIRLEGERFALGSAPANPLFAVRIQVLAA